MPPALPGEQSPRAVGQSATDDEDNATIAQSIEGTEISSLQEISAALVNKDVEKPLRKRLQEAQGAVARAKSRRVRSMLAMMCSRSFYWSVTGLHRKRYTIAQGQMGRVAAEAAALAKVVADEPSLAADWLEATTEEEGRQFYRRTRDRLSEILDLFLLKAAWNRASGWAEHPRFAAIAGSLVSKAGIEGDLQVHEISVGIHEGVAEPQSSEFLHFIGLLRTQERIFRLLIAAFPELDDPLLTETRMTRFRESVDELWAKFERTFPDVAKSARSRADAA